MEYNKKEELFDKITGLKYMRQGVPKNWYNKGVDDSFRYIKNFFDKEFVPEVPQYVADWYEDNKGNLDYNLWNYIMDWEDTEEDSFKRWVNSSKDAFQTIINMHQFGYKVEKEKKYLVKIKGDIQENILVYGYGVKRYFFSSYMYGNRRTYHTKEELEAGGFGGVFDNPMIEVEEVDE